MPSAAKGAVLIMSEKKTSGIKNFFEEFKAFAMRGNVLDMAVGVVVGSAFTAIVGIGVGAFLNAIINFLIVAFVLFVTIKAINMLHKKPVEEPKEPTTKKCPYCQSEISIKAVRCPHCTSKLEGFPEINE